MSVTHEEIRALIAEARAQAMDPEARPWIVVTVVRAREPGMRVRVLPGVPGEVLVTEPAPLGVRVAARVFCDDLERWLDRQERAR